MLLIVIAPPPERAQRRRAEPCQPAREVRAVGGDREVERGAIDGLRRVDEAIDERGRGVGVDPDLGEGDLVEVVLRGDRAAGEPRAPDRQLEILELEHVGDVAGDVDPPRQPVADRLAHLGGQVRPEIEGAGHDQAALQLQRAHLHRARQLELAAGAARDGLLDRDLLVDVVDHALDAIDRERQRRLLAHRQVDPEAGQREGDLGQRQVRPAHLEVTAHVGRVLAERGAEVGVQGLAQVLGVGHQRPRAVEGPVPVVLDVAAQAELRALGRVRGRDDLERVGEAVLGPPARQLGQALEREVIERDRVRGIVVGVEDLERRPRRHQARAWPRAGHARADRRPRRGQRIGQREVEFRDQRVRGVHEEEAARGDVLELGAEGVRDPRIGLAVVVGIGAVVELVVAHEHRDVDVAQGEVADVEDHRLRDRDAVAEAGLAHRVERGEQADHALVVGVERVGLVDLLQEQLAAVDHDVAHQQVLVQEQRVRVDLAGDHLGVQQLPRTRALAVPHRHTSDRDRHPAAGGERRELAGRPLDGPDLDPAADLAVEHLRDAAGQGLTFEQDPEDDRGDARDQSQHEPDHGQPAQQFSPPGHRFACTVPRPSHAHCGQCLRWGMDLPIYLVTAPRSEVFNVRRERA